MIHTCQSIYDDHTSFRNGNHDLGATTNFKLYIMIWVLNSDNHFITGKNTGDDVHECDLY